MHTLHTSLQTLQSEVETLLVHATMYAKWPIEALSVRAGLATTEDASGEEKKADDQHHRQKLQEQLQVALDRQMVSVDRLDRMPSPFLVATIENLQQRLDTLSRQAHQLKQQQQQSSPLTSPLSSIHSTATSNQPLSITSVVQYQNSMLIRLGAMLQTIHQNMKELRLQYSLMEQGTNVLEQADIDEWKQQREREQEAQYRYLKALQESGGQAVSATTTAAAAPASGGLFGASTAPVPAFGAAPATSGFSFASAGAAPAPSAFGAAAPAPSAFSYTATPNKKKSSSRSRDRLSK
jgi:hypothetical protein